MHGEDRGGDRGRLVESSLDVAEAVVADRCA
jgi:hypothetical protein